MSSLPARPYTFKPRGLYDALTGDGAPDGACSILTNFVHDMTTPFVWIARPGAVALTDFPSLPSPSNISVMLAIGTKVFGMIGTARFPGYDEPFCYDVSTRLFTSITGPSATNLPATQSMSGAWTPPTMDVVGSKIIVTHPGFSGSGSNFFGVIDISTPATPSWSAANTTTNALPAVPNAVKQFDNRAWFAVNNRAYYSDSLAPTTITNASQFLTLGSTSSNVIGFGGLQISQTQGGVLAGLAGFKDVGFWQILPDATVTYKLNGPFPPGTRAPRSIAQTPKGILYAADSGIYLIGLDGTPSAAPLPGVRSPIALATTPSRIAACYNDTVYRVGLQTTTNVLTGTIEYVEYWYDFEINEWTGPHKPLSSSMMVGANGTFIVASTLSPGVLYQSDAHGNSAPETTEFGQAMQVWLQSVILAQDDMMAVKTLIESQIDISFGSAANSLTAQWLSAAEGQAGTATVTAQVGTYWNQFNWNEANWSPAQYGLRTYNLDWDQPVVYKTGAFAIFGTLTQNLRIGPARFRTAVQNQMNTQNPP